MATQAFKVQRATLTIATSASSVTFTAGTHYTAPAGITKAFVRLANTRITGMGQTSAGGNGNAEDMGCIVSNPGNLLTNVIVTRTSSSATLDCRVTIEIVEYVGDAGGANEFIVRDQGTVSGTAAALTGTTVTTIADENDVVVWITGQLSQATGRADMWQQLFTAQLVANGADWDPTFDRTKSSTPTVEVSYAVVEFTGSNWSVKRQEINPAVTTWSPGDSNSGTVAITGGVADKAKTFVHVQYRTSNDPTGVDDGGDMVLVDSTTNFLVRQRATSNDRFSVIWVVENSQADGTARNLEVQHLSYADDTTTGAEERSWTQAPSGLTGGSAVTAVAETSLICTVSMDGSATSGMQLRGAIDYRLTGTDQITFTESDMGQERRFGIQVIEWPEDPAAGGVFVAADVASRADLSSQTNILKDLRGDVSARSGVDTETNILKNLTGDLASRARLDTQTNVLKNLLAEVHSRARLDTQVTTGITHLLLVDLASRSSVATATNVLKNLSSNVEARARIDTATNILKALSANVDSRARLGTTVNVVRGLLADVESRARLDAAVARERGLLADLHSRAGADTVLTVGGIVAFMVTPSRVSFLFNVDRTRFEHLKIAGGTLDPAFYVSSSKFGWLNNKIRFQHIKIT